MIVSRSVNNEIFIGDYFKLRIQVLQRITEGWRGALAKKVRKFPCIVSSEDTHPALSSPIFPSNKFFNAKADMQRQFPSKFLLKTNIKYIHNYLQK